MRTTVAKLDLQKSKVKRKEVKAISKEKSVERERVGGRVEREEKGGKGREGKSESESESGGGREVLMTVEPPALCPAVKNFESVCYTNYWSAWRPRTNHWDFL